MGTAKSACFDAIRHQHTKIIFEAQKASAALERVRAREEEERALHADL